MLVAASVILNTCLSLPAASSFISRTYT